MGRMYEVSQGGILMDELIDGYIHCFETGCDAKIKDHKWAKVKSEGWCHLKDGRSYCSEHIPVWYTEWKKNKAVKVDEEAWRKANPEL